jgi:3-oxoacyl-[acyl-carrier protein] reductase
MTVPSAVAVAPPFDLRGRRALVHGATHALGRAIGVALAAAGADVADVAGAGPLDILVTVTDAGDPVPFADLTPDRWHAALDAGVTGAFLAIRAARPRLSAGSSVVNVSAVRDGSHHAAVRHGAPHAAVRDGAHHAAASAALAGLTRSLARELGPDGIRVNLVVAGGCPADVAAVVAFLASDDAGFVTGETVAVGDLP